MLLKALLSVSLLSLRALAQGDLAAALLSQPDLSDLVGLAGLIPDVVTALAGASNITILAPTNAAFAALSNTSAEGVAVQSRNATAVAALLSNHVIQGLYNSSSIPDRTPAFVQTLLNSSLSNGAQPFTNTTGGQYIGVIRNGADVDVISGGLNVGRVTQADIALGSGIVIHKVDSVNRFGPTVQQYASGTGNTVVNQAIQAVGLSTASGVNSTTVSPLNSADLTFFLPNNQAFANIGSVVSAADNATIASVLSYHVVPNQVLFSTRLSNTSVTTLQGTNITVTVLDGDIFVNNARVVLANGVLFNGVAHIIDAVMNPANTTAMTNPDSDAAARVAFANASTVTSLGLTTIPASATTTFTTPTLLTTLAPVEGASGAGNGAMTFNSDLLGVFAATFGVLLGAIYVL